MEKLSLLLFSNSEFLILLCFTFVILGIGYFLYRLEYFKIDKHRSILSLILMMMIYAIISFWKLGSTRFPTTTWQPTAEKQQITFDLVRVKDLMQSIQSMGRVIQIPTLLLTRLEPIRFKSMPRMIKGLDPYRKFKSG